MANKLGYDLRDLIEYEYRDTLFPELVDLIGEENALKLIKVFGGIELSLPAYKRVVTMQRDIEIYETLCYVNTETTIQELAAKFGITEVWVREIFKMMRVTYEQFSNWLQSREENFLHITTKRGTAESVW